MKLHIIFITLMISSLGSIAQTFKPDADTKSTFRDYPAYMLDTVVTSNLSKSQLFSNGVRFVNSNFNNMKSVLDIKDLEQGELFFHGNISTELADSTIHTIRKKKYVVHSTRYVTLKFKARIYCKDQKAKIVLAGLTYDADNIYKDWTIYPKASTIKYNSVVSDLAMGLIKDMAVQIKLTPENEF